MGYDPTRQVTVLFGGDLGGDRELGDTWEWNGTEWLMRVSAGPSPRRDAVFSYDPVSGLSMSGGKAQGIPLPPQVWYYSDGVWTNPPPTAEPAGTAGGPFMFAALLVPPLAFLLRTSNRRDATARP
jgi:hypothetical protein